jgi:hypothetical protein
MQLFDKILGVPYKLVRESLKLNTTKVYCIYLITIDYVKELR